MSDEKKQECTQPPSPSRRAPWICIAGLHAWQFQYFTAGMYVQKCEHCGATRAEQ